MIGNIKDGIMIAGIILISFALGLETHMLIVINQNEKRQKLERLSNTKSNNTMEKNIYELKLHESTDMACGIAIMRVPGGWIYDMWDYEKDMSKTGTFVPLDTEFMDKKKEV
jgi:hypothetical protein